MFMENQKCVGIGKTIKYIIFTSQSMMKVIKKERHFCFRTPNLPISFAVELLFKFLNL